MSRFTEKLLKPIAPELRTVPQLAVPIYDSAELSPENFCGARLQIYRELPSSPVRPVQWKRVGSLTHTGLVQKQKEILLSTFPRNDHHRPIPSDVKDVTVWMLMGYLREVGPVEVSLAAMDPVPMKGESYIGYWGNISQLGWRLCLIREQTESLFLQNMVDDALLLMGRNDT